MFTDIISTPAGKIDDRQRPWGTDARMRFDAAACLPVRFAGQECGLCQPACPIHTIEMQAAGPQLQGDCIGCGQCAAACPTGALSTEGFALPAALHHGEATLHVDCWRVPFAESPRGALRVPCLAGIGSGWLLALFNLASTTEEQPIRLLDRGACSNCSAGAGMDNLRATLDEVCSLLDACGVDAARLPAIVSLPVSGRLTPLIPTAASETRMDRRGFFRGLMGGVARGAEQIATVRSGGASDNTPIVLRDNVAPLERMRIVSALTAIAARHDREVPAQALPLLSLGACDAHGICARICPTGALRWHEEGATAELRFHAARCIACGQCARLCPDRAIRVAPSGGTAVVEILAHWQARECVACGEPFFGADNSICPECTKHQQLFQGVTALFRLST